MTRRSPEVSWHKPSCPLRLRAAGVAEKAVLYRCSVHWTIPHTERGEAPQKEPEAKQPKNPPNGILYYRMDWARNFPPTTFVLCLNKQMATARNFFRKAWHASGGPAKMGRLKPLALENLLWSVLFPMKWDNSCLILLFVSHFPFLSEILHFSNLFLRTWNMNMRHCKNDTNTLKSAGGRKLGQWKNSTWNTTAKEGESGRG